MSTTWHSSLYPAYLAAVRCDFALLALQRLVADIILYLSTHEAAIKVISIKCVHSSVLQGRTHLGSWKLRGTPGW